ncbi:PREDICTED: TBC1 domain family member 7-like [Priapulus caudatus]|uniref:TBC1 domain family member 7 n=1 Tax=Priapulus caudatus TaxID=37621 RepID=A0ABM1F480_PRICU|nr:PREDICTED: TBC1 domain family member 7-like [Priapulus caudatus]
MVTVGDDRNFRSHYYEKVGFRGIEEKKSLEILLKEQPLELQRLAQYCLRFPVPSMFRELVWKVLLGVLPPHHSIHEFVSEQRAQQYHDLEHALRVMRRVDDSTPTSWVFLKMACAEDGCLGFDDDNFEKESKSQAFVKIASVFLELFDNPVDAYCLTRGFVRIQEDKYRDYIGLLVQRTEDLLKKEAPKLHAHLVLTKAIHVLPLHNWYLCCFAGVLPEGAIERLWDIVIGGSFKVMAFISVALLVSLERHILGKQHVTDIVLCTQQELPEETADMIVSKALEMWQAGGCLLMPST